MNPTRQPAPHRLLRALRPAFLPAVTALLLASCASPRPAPKSAAAAAAAPGSGQPAQVSEAEDPVLKLMRQAAGTYGPGPESLHTLGRIDAKRTDSGTLTATLSEDGRTLRLQGTGQQTLLMHSLSDRQHYATFASTLDIHCELRPADFKHHPQGAKPEQLVAASAQGCTMRGGQEWGPAAEWAGKTGQYSATQWPAVNLIHSPAGFKILISWPTEAIKLHNPHTAQVQGLTVAFWRK